MTAIHQMIMGSSFVRQSSSSTTANVTSIGLSLNGATGLTLINEGSIDDTYFEVAFPFTVSFLGQNFNSVFVGSNSYLTFGGGSYIYYGFSSMNPPFKKILIGAADNSIQRIYSGSLSSPSRFLIRFEGTASTYGYVGSPTIVWEAVFYQDTPKIVDIHIGIQNRAPYGFWGVYTEDTLVKSLPKQQNQAYRIESLL